jgi:peptidoglycan L-alanyl-D-glutamate endopeptidase CwlK
MAADLGLLVAEFRGKVEELIANCAHRGVEMRPHGALRTPFEQARLWRQSRAREEIEAKIDALRADGADFLAHCLESVGPEYGKHVTNAIPGLSWHQFGEAADCFWVVNGEAEWSPKKKVDRVNGYHVYAEEAERLGLTAGGNWPGFKDWPHVQMRGSSNALKVMSLQEINNVLKERFA